MNRPVRRAWKVSAGKALHSTIAIAIGLAAVTALSFGTNKLVRSIGLFAQGAPAAAVVYRSVYTVLGGYLAARLSPSRPMHHALGVGAIEVLLACTAAIVVVPLQYFGPAWYYYALAGAALPCAWLGGRLQRRRRAP